ncbi:MAG: hypothetical protein NC223_10315 [Butyrivibrio sp.]|nr:hypothetical protein [Butyrivibrio sp.]
MSAEKLMNAIGGINDKHIAEFAGIKERLSVKYMRINAAAVVLFFCAAAMSAMLFAKSSMGIHNIVTEEATQKRVKTVWWGGFKDFGDTDSAEQVVKKAEKGVVTLTDKLKKAIEDSDDASNIFAVQVCKIEEVPKETVYDMFVKPSGVEEQYMENGWIFATAEQIESLVCPPEFAIVLELADLLD